MNKALLLVGGIALGASVIYLMRGFKEPKTVTLDELKKRNKAKKAIGFSALGVGLVLIGVSVKTGAFKR